MTWLPGYQTGFLVVALAKEAEEAHRAAIDAACMRLHPILMSSFAFILGVVPLITATGAGFEMRLALGIAVFSGIVGVTRSA